MERHYALLGKSLTHSYSKTYFESKFAELGLGSHSYSLVELPSLDGVRQTVVQLGLDGFNVTIPYKQTIIPFLDWIDPAATEIGAVNTVKVLRNMQGMRLEGYNTDAPAFLRTLRSAQLSSPSRALILGTGGAAQAVAWALRRNGTDYRFVSRSPNRHSNTIGYDDIAALMPTVDLIVNATPVGMFPDVDASPLPCQHLLSARHICYDLVYNPSPTLFLRQASQKGARTADGLQMLHLQADMAFEIWER